MATENRSARGASSRAFSAVGIASAVIIAILINVLAGRFYARWDWTPEGEYSLSTATVETLQDLESPVEVIVFAGTVDAWRKPLADMLDAYGAHSRNLKVRFVDPDSSPVEFEALQKKYGIAEHVTQDGTVLVDTRVVIAKGDRKWYVTDEDLIEIDTAVNRARPRIEQAFTEGIRNVLDQTPVRICFTKGHEEAGIDDAGNQGLGELKHTLLKNNYVPVAVDLSVRHAPNPLDGCRVVIVAGLGNAFEPAAAQILANYFEAGGNLLLLVPPLLDQDGRFSESGLEDVAALAGVEFGRDLAVETNESLYVPGDVETFITAVRPHAVTGALGPGTEEGIVLVTGTQSLKAKPGFPARPLLTSSPTAFGVGDVRPYVEAEMAPTQAGPADHPGPLDVAIATELRKPEGSDAAHGPRMVVVGTPSVAWSENWRRPELRRRADFIESVVAWLAAQPALVSVPQKRGYDIGLNLTADDVGAVQLYVLAYMPGAAFIIGFIALWIRRSSERKSRRARSGGGDA